tara:strand:+ start:101 stop:865 length:765 start_codon:yes stop_codon:yes gene_type:complete
MIFIISIYGGFVNILLSNDDGCKSLGLKVLRNALGNFGNVLTVSPHKDISASSSCLSVHHPVKTVMISKKFYKVYGTPADCVHIGSRGILKKYPDIVFSGINFGSNMGDDVVYSGTVGAAIEGRHAKLGSYAISINSRDPKYLDDLPFKTQYILDFIFTKLQTPKTVFNINIPDIPFSKIKGIKVSLLGKRKISRKAKKILNKKNTFYEIGDVGMGINIKGTDFHSTREGYVSITPIMIDMTDIVVYKKLQKLI